jgi:hypothetical protein
MFKFFRTVAELSQDGRRPIVEPVEILRLTLQASFEGRLGVGVSVPPENPFWVMRLHPEKVGERERRAAEAEWQRIELGFREMHNQGRLRLQGLPEIEAILAQYPNPEAFVDAHLSDERFLKRFVDEWFVHLGCPEARGRAPEVIQAVPYWRACLAAQLFGI